LPQDLHLWTVVIVEVVTVCVKEKSTDSWKCKYLGFQNAALSCTLQCPRLAAQHLVTESDLKSWYFGCP